MTRQMLVTGAAGMVGSYVPAVFGDWKLTLTDSVDGYRKLDICDPVAVMRIIDEVHPDYVLHLAAATDVDRCEQEPDWAYHVNSIGTQNLALACQAQSIPLIYISSAAVFSGDKSEPYTEFDLTTPSNVYGNSKLAGEQIVSTLLQRFYIVRAGWMVGGGERDKKFLGKILRLILDGRKELKVVDDKVGSPTYAKDLLQGIRSLMETGYYGLYHMVNSGPASRYEIALFLRDVLDKQDVIIQPVSSAFFPLPAPRGRSEAVRNLKLQLLGLDQMRPWQDAVREYLVNELLPSLSPDSPNIARQR
ncbi:MAG TPA: dTDP-4-dehydrorhamnose reductase [Terriglobia bacterium]|nr:dTDP-4-dehydrorhamnose reductase [Terriglobia bacterium]